MRVRLGGRDFRLVTRGGAFCVFVRTDDLYWVVANDHDAARVIRGLHADAVA